jgi:hypothetical protein
MKTMTLNRMLTLALLAAGTTWLFTGCGTSAGYKQADKTGQGIADFREEIVKGKQAIDTTMATLNQIEVQAVSNPRKAYEKFCKDVANLDSVAAKAKKRGQDMKEQGQAYFRQWEMQMAQVKDPAIQKLSQQRQAKLRETFDNIKKYTEPLKAQFDPWMADLKSVQSYLGQDLTVAGVNAAKDIIAKTKAEGREVQKSMDALIAELNSVSATITPANVPPPTK